MSIRKRITRTLTAVTFGTAMLASAVSTISTTVYAEPKQSSNVLEHLDRGISAVKVNDGMLVSWRWNGDDDNNAVFKLYRDDTLIYTADGNKATCFLDKAGNGNSKYRVDTYSGNTLKDSQSSRLINGNGAYFDVPLSPPGSGYTPNDMSVGDVDGDGQYELFLKWDPDNSKDNSQKGTTGNVFIDCYTLQGKRLWRIDLGQNIRAGAHYTQFYVADFDLDGKAEMTCKTADGTKDGKGTVIGDGSKSYRNSSGYILSGPEYYTLFDGATGAALDTVDYKPARGDVSKWGDKYGNRVDRFWGTVAYLDGVHPCVVTGRGYYTRLTATAYKVENKKLVEMWAYDSGNSNSSSNAYGDGNHNSMPADVDGDGKQEIITGAAIIDDNGKLYYTTNQGHGDAMHVGDLDPTNPGLEAWICHEEKSSGYGVSLIDLDAKKVIYHQNGAGDTGRCCADNVWSGNPGAECWGNKLSDNSTPVVDTKGNTLNCRRPSINFLIYWDGDLEREILDGYTDSPATISKMTGDPGKTTITNLLQTTGYYTCNTTKGTPCLSADIFGDWREELIVRAADAKSVRIFCTPYETSTRLTTLMHDAQYRMQVSSQNTAYNQPPHPSFFLGTGYDIPARSGYTVLGGGTTIPVTPTEDNTPAVFNEGSTYMIKNVNSGLYIDIDGAKAENNVNAQQWGVNEPGLQNTFKLISAGDGYYYIVSAVGDGGTYVLDIAGKKTENGTNICIYQYKGGDNQKFKFVKNPDGSYKIKTKITGDKSVIEVADAEKNSGANIQQWEINGAGCQDWILEPVTNPGCQMDTSFIYTFKNVNSGMVMDITDGKMSDNSNVQQWGSNGFDCQKWTLKPFGSGNYYYIRSVQDPNYVLKAEGSANGSNIDIVTYSNKDSSMLFRFSKNPDGSYNIITHASREAAYVEVASASKDSGGNIQQWTPTNSSCQNWTAVTELNTTVSTAAETEETTTVTTVSEPKDIKGDVDDNALVEKDDVIMLQKFLVKKENLKAYKRADMNNDGVINVFDLILLKRTVIKR